MGPTTAMKFKNNLENDVYGVYLDDELEICDRKLQRSQKKSYLVTYILVQRDDQGKVTSVLNPDTGKSQKFVVNYHFP